MQEGKLDIRNFDPEFTKEPPIDSPIVSRKISNPGMIDSFSFTAADIEATHEAPRNISPQTVRRRCDYRNLWNVEYKAITATATSVTDSSTRDSTFLLDNTYPKKLPMYQQQQIIFIFNTCIKGKTCAVLHPNELFLR